MFQNLVLISLVILLIVEKVLHHRQVQDLSLKIKANTVEEYAVMKESERKPEVQVPEVAAIPLDQVHPDKLLELLQREEEDDQGE